MSNIYKLNQKGDETIMLKNNSELFEELSDRQSEMLSGGITSYTILERTFRDTSSCVDEAFLSMQQARLNPKVSNNAESLVFARPNNNNLVIAACYDSLDAVVIYSAGSDSLSTHRNRARAVSQFYT
ncbi:MAG: hypothetical protein QNJ55_26330 [Xenococcus sp. MO_188.B8]|nr:hypothetical protein [Xenococcus sp. MO_188.B8]